MTQKPEEPAYAAKKINTPQPQGPQQDRSVRTRALVLTAAAKLFATKGFRRTSVQDVATEVKMTKGAVYFHFPNKEALALSVVDSFYSRWPQLIEEVRAEGRAPIDTLEELIRRVALAFRDDPIVQATDRLQIERPSIDAELPTPYVDWISLLTTLLEQAREAGELKPGIVPETAARTLVATFFGAQHISDVLEKRADLMERWDEMSGLVMSAIRA